MSETPLHDQLEGMEADLEFAKARRDEAKEEVRVGRFELAASISGPLAKFHSDIEFHKPEATLPAEREAREAELIAAVFEQIRENGFSLRPVADVQGGISFQVKDPNASRVRTEADAEATTLTHEIGTFKQRNAAGLKAERQKIEADRIKAALAGDDADAIREALNPAQGPAGVFTTRDLPNIGTVHNRSAARAAA